MKYNFSQTKPFAIAGSILGLGILIAASLILRNSWTYKECLKTWPSAQSQALIKSYRLTREDLCKKGYTLSEFFLLQEHIADEIRVGGKYDKEELKARIKDTIKPDVIENPF